MQQLAFHPPYLELWPEDPKLMQKEEKKKAHKQTLLPSRSVFLAFTSVHRVYDTLTNHQQDPCAIRASLHIKYRTTETL